MSQPFEPLNADPAELRRADRADANRVRYGVRNLALLKERFTVGAIVEQTGFNSSSVHTEIQRMKREGLIELAPAGARRRPVTYQVKDDSEARERLVRSIEAFLPPAQPAAWPSSPSYHEARRLLNRAQIAPVDERSALLAEAAEDLEMADLDEGEAEAPPLVAAYLALEQARLAWLRGESAAALGLCQSARAAFGRERLSFMVDAADDLRQVVEHDERRDASQLLAAERAPATPFAALLREPPPGERIPVFPPIYILPFAARAAAANRAASWYLGETRVAQVLEKAAEEAAPHPSPWLFESDVDAWTGLSGRQLALDECKPQKVWMSGFAGAGYVIPMSPMSGPAR